MNATRCPHCGKKLGNYLYAYACPHCDFELVRDRGTSSQVLEYQPPTEPTWLVRWFRRIVLFVET